MARPIGKRNGKTRAQVRAMLEQGMTVRQIAYKLKLSTQAIYQHIDYLRSEGDLPKRRKAS